MDIIRSTGTEVLKNAGTILDNLSSRRLMAKADYDKIMAEVDAGGVTDELYDRIIKLLGRYKKTKVKFNEERSPVTSSILELTKPFIQIENDFDINKPGSLANNLKVIADRYAADKQKEENERNEKLRKQNLYDSELAGLEVKAQIFISKKFLALKNEIISKIDSLLNSMSLENSEEIRQDILTIDTIINPKIFDGFEIETTTVYVGDVEKKTIFNKVKESSHFTNATLDFENTIVAYQAEASQKIPAIIAELEEIAKSENEEVKKQLEQAKQNRIEQEQQEAQQDIKTEEKNLEMEEASKEQISSLQSQFEFGAVQAEIKKSDIKKKVDYEIELVLPAGIQEIFKFWIANKDIGTDIEKIKRWNIDRMIKFAEKEYNKNDKKIVSQYVIYKEVVKAKI